jgi:hypothetical protein
MDIGRGKARDVREMIWNFESTVKSVIGWCVIRCCLRSALEVYEVINRCMGLNHQVKGVGTATMAHRIKWWLLFILLFLILLAMKKSSTITMPNENMKTDSAFFISSLVQAEAKSDQVCSEKYDPEPELVYIEEATTSDHQSRKGRNIGGQNRKFVR